MIETKRPNCPECGEPCYYSDDDGTNDSPGTSLVREFWWCPTCDIEVEPAPAAPKE
jgi:hypothetical protein